MESWGWRISSVVEQVLGSVLSWGRRDGANSKAILLKSKMKNQVSMTLLQTSNKTNNKNLRNYNSKDKNVGRCKI